MPSKTPEQKKFMQAVANNPKFAKKVKVPVKVGKEFVKADKAEGAKMKKYAEGGDTAKTKSREKAERMERYRMTPGAKIRDQSKGMVGPDVMSLPSKAYDSVRSVVSPRNARSSEEMSELTREVARGEKQRPVKSKQKLTSQERQMLQEVQDEKDRVKAGKAYDDALTSTVVRGRDFKSGGSVSKRADGIAQRGKTNCKMR
jgi:hypothetical protein